MAIGHLEPIEIYQVPVNDNLTLPYSSQTIADDINVIRTVIKRILGTSSFTNTSSLESLQSLTQFKTDINNWKNTVSLPSGLIKATSIDYSVVTNPNTYPAILNNNSTWIKLNSFSSNLDGSNKLKWNGLSYTAADIDAAITATTTITNIQSNINSINTQISTINTTISSLQTNKIDPSYLEIFGTTYSYDPNRSPILQRLNDLESAISGFSGSNFVTQQDLNNAITPIQNQVNTLTTTVNGLTNLPTLVSDINTRLTNIEKSLHINLFASKTNDNAVLILNSSITNTLLNNDTQKLIDFLSLATSIKNNNYDFYIIPIVYQDFLANSTNIKNFLYELKKAYISLQSKNISKPVILLVFNKSIDSSINDISALPTILENEGFDLLAHIGFQIEPTYLDKNGSTIISFNSIKSYFAQAFNKLREKMFIFSRSLDALYGLLPKEILDSSVILTSSRYAWKKTLNSVDVDFKNYYNINFIDDLFDISFFCSVSNPPILCNLLYTTPGLYSDLSFIDLTIDNSTYDYNTPHDISLAYMKVKSKFFVDIVSDSNIQAFSFFANTSSSPWTLNTNNGPKKAFIGKYPKISLLNIDTTNNIFTNQEPNTYSTNDFAYNLYSINQNDFAGNVFEFSGYLSFIFNETNFNAHVAVGGILDILSTYNNLIDISLSSTTLTIADSSNASNSVSFTLTTSSLHFVVLNFEINTSTNSLDIIINVDNMTNTLSISNITEIPSPVYFSVTNTGSQNLLFSKLYV